MRISDWSSDVCSSDLSSRKLSKVSLSCFVAPLVVEAPVPELTPETAIISSLDVDIHAAVGDPGQSSRSLLDKGRFLIVGMRSEERRVGKECVSTCRSRWSPDH